MLSEKININIILLAVYHSIFSDNISMYSIIQDIFIPAINSMINVKIRIYGII